MGMDTPAVFFGVTVMTVIIENAALNYLRLLLEGLGQ